MNADDVVNQRLQLFRSGFENFIGEVIPHHRLVRRYRHDVEFVNSSEFGFLGDGGTGHSGKLFIESEIVLEGYCGYRAVFAAHADAFLRLYRLVQPLGIPSSRHLAPGELVDNDYFVVFYDVVAVARHQIIGTERRIDFCRQLGVFGVAEVVDIEIALGFGYPLLAQVDLVLLFFFDVVVFFQRLYEFVGLDI